MKTVAVAISIPKPCLENWDKMENKNGNKFCQSCNKTVIDFTTYHHADIVKAVMAEKGNRLCGRMSSRQLNSLSYTLIAVPSKHNWPKHLGVLAIGTLFLMQSCSKGIEEHKNLSKESIYGYVVDDSRQPVPGASVVIEGINFRAITDQNGRYEILNKNRHFNRLLIGKGMLQESLIIDRSKVAQDTVCLSEIEYIMVGEIEIAHLNPKK